MLRFQKALALDDQTRSMSSHSNPAKADEREYVSVKVPADNQPDILEVGSFIWYMSLCVHSSVSLLQVFW